MIAGAMIFCCGAVLVANERVRRLNPVAGSSKLNGFREHPESKRDRGRFSKEDIRTTGYTSLLVRFPHKRLAQVLGAASGRNLAARSHAKYPEWYSARKNRKHNGIAVDAIREQLALVRS